MSKNPKLVRYTPCGHSIKKLRCEANRCKKVEGVTYQKALDRIAKELKYSGWAELIGQKFDPKRDDFFQGMYVDRKDSEITRSLYSDYLDQNNLTNSQDTYRQFVVQHWASFKALGMTNLDLDGEPMHPDVLLEELTAQIKRGGAPSLLPQHMGTRLLEATIWAGKILKSERDIPNEIRQGYLQTALLCLSGIRAFQLKSQQVTFEEDELLELVEQYYMLAELELTSRRTGLSFVLPDIDHVFQPNAKLSFRFPDNFRNMTVPNRDVSTGS